MQAAPKPANESERLRALQDLQLLDTPPEERFDQVVHFAAEQLGMPIALFSLIDGDRQWFKSRFGTAVVESPRDTSFCGHTILQPGLFLVGNASQDPRFADNPMVAGEPHIRFYAGMPVSAPGGERVGTLCVLDTVPRVLGPVEISILKVLRNLVDEAMTGREANP